MLMRTESTMLIICLGLTVIAASAAGQSVEITTQSKNITVNRNDNFSLPCGVRGPGSYKVSWWFLDHHMKISINYTILTADQHYEILQPLGRSNQYNLQLKRMNEQMVGHYQCKIDGTLVSRTHTVNIAGYKPNRGNPNRTVDFTDCCRQEGVTQACLPACNPSAVPADFDSNNCATDLVKLLKCGSDGRNHVPCCRRRMVPDHCFDYCMNKTPDVLHPMHNECLERAEDVSACYMEGQSLLPGPPGRLKVDNLNSNSVIIVWEPPPDRDTNPLNDVKGYRIFLKEQSSSHYKVSGLLTNTVYIWRNLDPNKKYMVYAVSIGVHGSSLPSYIAEFYGAAVKMPRARPPGDEYRSTMECCQMRNVSAKCQQLMCSGVPVDLDSVPDTDIFGCFGEVHNALQCIAYERNHTQCCMRRNVPTRCHDICEGKVPRNFTQIDCLTVYMRRIISCFEEGKGILPGPPIDVELDKVTNASMIVRWHPPSASQDPVKLYMVSYREEGHVEFKQKQTNGTSLLLENLHAGTKYEVKVSSIGTQGSSLPSTALVALTYYEYESVLPFTTPSWRVADRFQTFPECCESKGVIPACQFLCNYTTDLSEIPAYQLLGCQADLGKFLSCGTDNRNHSSCCAKRGVMPKCLPFCAFSHEVAESFVFNFDHIDCVYQSSSIIECMQEGQGLLPTEPIRVSIVNRTTHTISVIWKRPRYVPDNGLMGYLLKYKLADSPLDFAVKNLSARTNYIIQNLEPGKRYVIQLLAHSIHGTSLPSVTVQTFTASLKPDNPPLLPDLNFTTPGNVSDCCMAAGLNSACLETCDGKNMVHISQCTSELQKLLSCSADKRDHKPCCIKHGVPRACQGLCEGRLVTAHISSLMCLPFIPQIMTCLREGYANLPMPPERLAIQDVLARSLKFSWNPPSKNSDGVWYNFYFGYQFNPTFNVKENVTSPLTLDGLTPSTFYRIFVVTMNKHGSSQPSAVMTVGTLEENRPTVQVIQRPPGYLREGSMVQLLCLAGGEPFPSIYWVTANDERSNATTLHFQSISRTATGLYTCIADNGFGRSSASIYLKVQYEPEAKAQEEIIYVQANRGLSAHLVCLFKGYPNISTINWEKDGFVLDPWHPNSRMNAWTKDVESEGVVNAFLEINNVLTSDAGTYECHGWNNYGDDSTTIKLSTDMTATPPTFVPAPASPNVTSCCMEQGVHPQCMVACTFDIDVSLVHALPDPLMCTMDLPKFASCAADGRDHSTCCKKKNVPEACWPVCSGVVSNLTVSLFICVEFISEIIDCMEEGHVKIPSPPLMVRAEQNQDGYIQVRWQPPKVNTDAVQHYNIFYKNVKTGIVQNKTEAANKRSSLLNGITGLSMYTIYMTASNHHGSSSFSNQANLNTTDMMMSPPQRLRGTVISYVRVRLDWDVPYRYPGSVQKYRIYYRAQGWTTYQNFTTPGANATVYLETLSPGVKYEIYMTALSKNRESERSNVIAIETQVPPRLHAQTSRGNQIPLVLGVLFAVLVAAVAAGLLIFFLRKRTKAPTYKESVSFENPGYATTEARVTGIPNYGTEEPPIRNGINVNGITNVEGSAASSPSSKGSINDDSSDQGYSTLTPSEPLPYNAVTSSTNGYIPYDGYSNHSIDSNGVSVDEPQGVTTT